MMKTTDHLGPYEVTFEGSSAIVHVPSRTGDATHRVLVTPGFLTCNCRGYVFRQRCWHTEAVLSLITKG